MYLSTNLKFLRSKNKITLRKLEKEVDVSHVTITEIESGKRKNPTLINICNLSKYFNVTLDDLVYKDLRK